MDKGSKSEVEGDIPRNLIHIRYRGQVTCEELKACAEKVKSLLPQMRKGFAMLTDISDLESMELECVPVLTQVMDECREKGIGTVVRIVPNPKKDIGFNILSIVHYRRGVRIVTCQTAAQAEKVLA